MVDDEEGNLELQESEYETLVSSFDKEDITVEQDTDAGRYSGIFTAFLTLSTGEPLSVIGPDGGPGPDGPEPGNEAAKNTENRRTVAISHLPPVNLRFSMPPGYPTACPPEYELCASWVPPASLSRLKKELARICEENKGGFALFAMFQFLQQEAGDCLEFPENVFDLFAVVSAPNIRAGLFRFIIECDSDQKEMAFRRQVHECSLCASDKMGQNLVLFRDCGHFYCIDCLTRGFKLHVQEGKVELVKCFECDARIPHNQLRGLIGEELFERYERLLLSRGLDSMADIMQCPRPHCNTPVLLDVEESLGICSACSLAFCMHCQRTYHGVNPCKIKDMSKMLQAYMGSTADDKRKMETIYGKRNLEKIIENHQNEQYIAQQNRCPACKSPVEKIDGCNKMTCYKCGRYFCWLCNCVLDAKNPYAHYSTGQCAKMLFAGTLVRGNDPFEDLFELEGGLLNENDDVEIDFLVP